MITEKIEVGQLVRYVGVRKFVFATGTLGIVVQDNINEEAEFVNDNELTRQPLVRVLVLDGERAGKVYRWASNNIEFVDD